MSLICHTNRHAGYNIVAGRAACTGIYISFYTSIYICTSIYSYTGIYIYIGIHIYIYTGHDY